MVVVEGCPSICTRFFHCPTHRVGNVLSNGRITEELSMNFLDFHVVLLLGLFWGIICRRSMSCLIPILILKAFTLPYDVTENGCV
jgi:hypothetical protein